MAKVKGPLFSLDASGKLADALVFMKWKGIQDVRKYVIPANPKTSAQTVQRTYMSDAVDLWHETTWNEDDYEAWEALAARQPRPMSGFNVHCKLVIDAKVAGNTWTALYGVEISSVSSSGFTVEVSVASDKTAKLYYGTDPDVMLNEVSGTYASNKYTFTLTGLTANTKYYFYIKNTAEGEGARTGIYNQTTSAS